MFNDQILVMNRSWMPVAVTTVRRGMSLVFRNHARIVDHDSFDLFDWERWLAERSASKSPDEAPVAGYIHTVNLRIELPQVIILSRYNGVPNRSVPFSRRTLFRRDNHECQYCGGRPGVRNLSIDHVLPRSRGGGTDWLNCVVSCVRCNVRKGNRTPEEAGINLRRRPFRPSLMEGLGVGQDMPKAWERFLKV
ncbi:MAG: HNH endonuclease [Planctomycetaceae bacterium]|nr:HNH endonuclease [Planctomycetaceae bacterium]